METLRCKNFGNVSETQTPETPLGRFCNIQKLGNQFPIGKRVSGPFKKEKSKLGGVVSGGGKGNQWCTQH